MNINDYSDETPLGEQIDGNNDEVDGGLDENDEMVDDDEPNEDMDGDFDSAMASAGMGTDEDYNHYEVEEVSCLGDE